MIDVTVTVTEIVAVPAPRDTVGATAPQSFVGKVRSTRTRQAVIIGSESVRTAILAVNGVTIGRGIGTEGHQEGRPGAMRTAPLVERGIHLKIGNEVPE